MAKDLSEMSDEEFEAYMDSAVDEDGNTEETQEEVEVDEVDTDVDESEDTEEEQEQDTEEEDSEEEQPESDADAEDSDDDETDDEEVEDETEEESDDDTAAGEEEEDEPTEESTETTETEVSTPRYKVRADGMDFEFTPDELVALAPKAMNYTKKMQQIAPYRKMISAMEDEGITEDQFNLAVSALKGDKDAITQMIKDHEIDTLDLDVENSRYQPKSYGRTETELEIDEVVQNISRDQEFTITKHIVDQQWDDESRDRFVENPKLIEALHVDIKNGNYDAVAPRMMKLKALDGGRKSDIEYYVEAGRIYHAERAAAQEAEAKKAEEAAKVEKVQKKQATQKSIKKAAGKRKAAAVTKAGGSKQKKVTDWLADDTLSDEEFSKLMEKQIRS